MTSPGHSAADQPNRQTRAEGNRWNTLWLVGSAVAMATGVTLIWLAAESTAGSRMTPTIGVVVALGVTLSLAAIWALGKWVPSFIAAVIDDIGGDSASHGNSPMLDGVVAVLTAVGAATPVYLAIALTTTGSLGNEFLGITRASGYALALSAFLRPLPMVWHAFRNRPTPTTAA